MNSGSVLERIGQLNLRMVDDYDIQNKKVSLNEGANTGPCMEFYVEL